MARIVVTTVGSLGDLHPMFPVAHALQRRGHTIIFAVPPMLQDAVDGERFLSHTEPIPPPPGGSDWNRPVGEIRSNVRSTYGPYLKDCVRVIAAAADGADGILSTPNQVATAIVGQRRSIPWATLTVFPGLIPSGFTVPEPHWLPALPTPAGRAVNRLTWLVYGFAQHYLASEVIKQTVEAQGLAMDSDLFGPGALSPHLCLVLTSPLYSPRQADWPQQIKVTGFTEWDRPDGWTPPTELERFLDGGPPPVVVTTSMARNAALFFTMARSALELSSRRAILLTGLASDELLGSSSHAILDNGIAAWRYIPLSFLLPRASFVVHHAGIGTTIATIRHGLPALAIPTHFDHWYNAGRIKTLGVGRVVSGAQDVVDGDLRYKHLSVDRLIEEMALVENDPKYRNRALMLGAAMAGEDGTASACDEIEALLQRWVAA